MHHSFTAKAACACTALRSASRAVTRLYDDALVAAGMSVIQFAILRRIARYEPVPLMQLADLLVMDRTTLYRALRPMSRQGWVSVVSGEGRAKAVRLTGRGRQALADATSAWEGVQSKLLGKMGAEEWKSIEASLAKIVAVTKELAK